MLISAGKSDGKGIFTLFNSTNEMNKVKVFCKIEGNVIISNISTQLR